MSGVESNSCINGDIINLFEDLQCESPKKEEGKNIFVPNTFTPNMDGLNDFFRIKMEDVKDVNLLIFNRWGNLLYETDSKSENWDGTYNGIKVSSGTYVYVLSVVFNDGAELNRKGHINVLH